MIELIPYKPGHLDLMDKREVFAGDDELESRINSYVNHPRSVMFTMVAGMQVIAVIGGTVLWPGVAEIWSVTSELVKNYGRGFIRLVRSSLEYYREKFNIRRFQVTIPVNLPNAEKYASVLGFIREATLSKFGPDGSDYYLYARVY